MVKNLKSKDKMIKKYQLQIYFTSLYNLQITCDILNTDVIAKINVFFVS